MTISTEIDMKKLCDKDSAKEYYNNLPVPRFEVFFTYEEGGQTGWYYDPDTIKDDCYAIDTFNEAQSQAFSNTCSNYRQIVERQAEELEDMRKKVMESMELMIKMDKVIKEHSENNIPNEVVEEYFLSEIEGRIIKEEEINFLTKNYSLERCIKNACDNSEYAVKCKCLCEAHKTIWVELSEDGE